GGGRAGPALGSARWAPGPSRGAPRRGRGPTRWHSLSHGTTARWDWCRGRSTPAISWTSGRAPASSIGTASGRGRRSSTPECSWPLCPGFGCCTPRTPARRCGRSRRFWRGRATCGTSARWHGIERPRCCSSRSVCRPPGVVIGGSGRTRCWARPLGWPSARPSLRRWPRASARRSGSGLPRSSWCCKRSRRGRPHGRSSTRSARCSVKATTEPPDDPALPALAAIRALGLAVAIPALGLDDRPVELTLRGYTPGSRATFEVRAGGRHFALTLSAEAPGPEAELDEALAAVRLVGEGPVRVPPLLARDRSLQVLAIGWLEGPTAQELLKGRRGERA